MELFLACLKVFEDPYVQLEQYATPPHIAAHVVHLAETSFGDIEGKSVLDLGCGTGMLCAAVKQYNSSWIIGVDVDPKALKVAQQNMDDYDIQPVEFILSDVKNMALEPEIIDTVIMNPPFGTRRKGIDRIFLEQALHLVSSKGVVYSLHKTSTREYLKKKMKQWKVLGKFLFNLSKTFDFHRKNSQDIDVDLWRIQKP
eukprot:jgi/Galph1/3821/GphlegSOOS_G2469.1